MLETDTIELLNEMGYIWPTFSINPDFLQSTVAMWTNALKEYKPETAGKAIRHLATTHNNPPSLAYIVHTMETGSLTVDEAIEKCKPWAVYADQIQYANGSGYTPEKPEGKLPRKVTELFKGSHPAEGGWEDRFRWAWKDALPR